MNNKHFLKWYDQEGRKSLPWRNTTDAYHIYLSEIMLQQTQVKTVLERYYFQFLEKFPTLQLLSQASEEEVLKAWEGLGYYTRARNLHKCAQIVQTTLPRTAKELLELPGIGPSTANAIACFAFNEALPILDGNMKRILYRYFKTKKANDKTLWELVNKLFIKEYAYEFNQGMMDIGATICTHRNPKCDVCPLQETCQGKLNPYDYPEKKPKKIKPIRKRIMVIFQNGNHFSLTKGDKKLLGGLWAFSQYETYDQKGVLLGELKQIYTHFTLEAKIILCKENKREGKEWFTLKEIHALPLSKVDKKALELLENG